MKKIIFSLLLVFAICFARSEAASFSITFQNTSPYNATVTLETAVWQKNSSGGSSILVKKYSIDIGKNSTKTFNQPGSFTSVSGISLELFNKNRAGFVWDTKSLGSNPVSGQTITIYENPQSNPSGGVYFG